MRRSGISFLVLAVSVTVLLLLGACTQTESPSSSAPDTSEPTTAQDTTTAETTPTEEPAPTATTAPEATPTEEPEPAVGLVAFADGGRIGVAHPVQMDSVFLTTGPGDFGPVWSPDGSMIAFTRFYPVDAKGTYVMKADGSGITKVSDTTNLYNRPVWSPDGGRLAMIDRRPDTYGIWVVNSDGSDLVRLYEADRTMQHLAWSPSGETIAFTWNRGTRVGGLYLVPSDGSAEAQIVIESDANYMTRAGSIDWAPDGRFLAVRSRPLAPRGEESPIVPADQPILTIVQVNGDGTTTILHRVQEMAAGEWYPAWAPNSKTVAAITVNEDGTEQLSVISLLSGQATPLTEANSFKSPTWSPDGGRLLVTANTGDNPDGALMIVTLADIGMEWNMSMDMTADMEAADVQMLRTGMNGVWAPLADTDSLPTGKTLTISKDTIRVASFTFEGFT